MWWPAIGGLVVGIGGLIFPQALGVGYDTIGALLQGDVPLTTIAGILLVKSVIWAVSLGSGTSGGVLAPLLMMGGALGGLLSACSCPTKERDSGRWSAWARFWAARCARRSPAIIFALELTHDINVLLPLLVAVGGRAWLHGADAEAFHPDRKGGAPRVTISAANTPSIRWRSYLCAR